MKRFMKMLMWCLGLHLILAPLIYLLMKENYWYLATWMSIILTATAVFAEHMLNNK